MNWYAFHIPIMTPVGIYAPHLERIGVLPVAPFGKIIVTNGEYEFRLLTDDTFTLKLTRAILKHYDVPYREVLHEEATHDR